MAMTTNMPSLGISVWTKPSVSAWQTKVRHCLAHPYGQKAPHQAHPFRQIRLLLEPPVPTATFATCKPYADVPSSNPSARMPWR